MPFSPWLTYLLIIGPLQLAHGITEKAMARIVPDTINVALDVSGPCPLGSRYTGTFCKSSPTKPARGYHHRCRFPFIISHKQSYTMSLDEICPKGYLCDIIPRVPRQVDAASTSSSSQQATSDLLTPQTPETPESPAEGSVGNALTQGSPLGRRRGRRTRLDSGAIACVDKRLMPGWHDSTRKRVERREKKIALIANDLLSTITSSASSTPEHSSFDSSAADSFLLGGDASRDTWP